jgi:hypothetical protein
MTNTLTVAKHLKEVGFSEAQATALTRAIEAAATAKAELVAARMSRDLAAIIQRSDPKLEHSDARFETTTRDQTRRIAAIVFSAIAFTASCRISSESRRQRKGASKNRNREQTTSEARDAQPPQRVGPSRRFARRSGSRRYAPPLPRPDRPSSPGLIFEEVLEDLKLGEFRWNCDASIPAH